MIDAREVGVAPGEDEVEVTLLGPGYGESIVVHIGQGRWIIVDSCINDAHEPQTLKYLLAIGIKPHDAVRLIVATHWHDDHIRGMAKVVDVCGNAEFCCAAALRREEFLAAIHALDGRGSFAGSSGVREIHAVFADLAERGRRPVFAMADRRFYNNGGCEIWSLSPHDDEFVRFLKSIGTLFPREGQTKTRIPDVSPNHVAVVLWIQVHDVVILLGADLETKGWVKIVESQAGRSNEERRSRCRTTGERARTSPRSGETCLNPTRWRCSRRGSEADTHCQPRRTCAASLRRPNMPT